MDELFISSLKLTATIGVYPEERSAPQPLRADIRLSVDTRRAAVSDEVMDTVDYRVVSDQVIQWASSTRFQLIETFAHTLVQKLFDLFQGIQAIHLTLYKFPIDMSVACVGVTVHRVREKIAVQPLS